MIKIHRFFSSRVGILIICLLATVLVIPSCQVDKEPQSKSLEFSPEELFRGIFLAEGEVAQKLDFFQMLLDAIERQELANPSLHEERALYNDGIVERINEINPDFITRLHSVVSSQNFNRIKEVLIEGGQLVKSAIILNEHDEVLLEETVSIVNEIDLKDYDFNDTQSVQKFLKEYEIVFEKLAQNGTVELGQDKCLWAAAVVAVVVWEAAVYVNVAIVLTVYAEVYALSGGGEGGGGGGGGSGGCLVIICEEPEKLLSATSSLDFERLVAQIAFELN